MRVLVTGSSGFIGKHVARALVEEGHEVTGFDLQPSDDTGVRSIVGDLLDKEGVEAACRQQEVVCHIGAVGDVYLAAERPELAASVNVTGSVNVARAARAQEAKIVYASTWEVYGAPRYEPVDEEHPCDPDHPYNITKLAGERILLALGRLEGVPVTSLRLGTAYGSGMRSNSVFHLFLNRARRGEPITIQGDGSQGRQFTHASDIARAFVLSADSNVHGTVFNVVSPETTSIKLLAEMIAERYPTDLEYTDPRPGDVPPSYVTAERIEETLGWKTQVPFVDGLTELIASTERE